MHITHKIDDFLFTIFPDVQKGDLQSLKNAIEDYYSIGPFKPKVTIEESWIEIEIDSPSFLAQNNDYKKVVEYCERGRYTDAKPILANLISKNPTISEFHRIMGQILSDEGDQEESINCLIDALRWDSKNGWALLMMGNILAKNKNDLATAMKYYDQALVANPDDYITINNIGLQLLNQGKVIEAKKYFTQVLTLNNSFPNTHLALSMIAEMELDLHSSFYSCIQSIKTNKNKDVLHQKSVEQLLKISNQIVESDAGKSIFKQYLHKLEFEGEKEIEIVQDETIETAAKIEFAENYDREKHLLKFNPKYPAIDHLIMHELVHLDFVIQARKENLNQLFVASSDQKRNFIFSIEPSLKKLKQSGVSEESITQYGNGLFDGLNLQVYNAPIDLFIEDFLFNEYVELRPIQFISLYNMVQKGLIAVTDKRIVDISPKEILSKSKIYNLVSAIQFRELFGIDLIKDYKATPSELKTANDFYDEFLQYKDNKEVAEEYELVIHWAQDLKLDTNFELINEVEYRSKRIDIDNLLKSIEEDPYDLESKDPYKEREMAKFLKSQENKGLNMAVVTFMVEALGFFEQKSSEYIKKMAFDIAMQGAYGYNPNNSNYRINGIDNKLFSGYHILAYYYVSWSIAIPESISELKLPFDEEYKMAKIMYKPNS
jgi:tetratricopeptide (TPR) repeat protein